MPLLTWIAQSPVILVSTEKLSIFEYGLLQLPVFGALIIGNITLASLAGKRKLSALIRSAALPMMVGLLLVFVSTLYFSHAHLWMVAGLSLYAFGLDLGNSALIRLILFSSDVSKGTVSAVISMINMMMFSIGITLAQFLYFFKGLALFSLFNLLCGFAWLWLIWIFTRTVPVEKE